MSECPHCGAAVRMTAGAPPVDFWWICGSRKIGGVLTQSEVCSTHAARIAELERELAAQQCPRCDIDGYWWRATRVAEERIAELERRVEAQSNALRAVENIANSYVETPGQQPHDTVDRMGQRITELEAENAVLRERLGMSKGFWVSRSPGHQFVFVEQDEWVPSIWTIKNHNGEEWNQYYGWVCDESGTDYPTADAAIEAAKEIEDES